MKEKNPIVLIIGILLFALGIFFCYKTYHTSYTESLTYKTSLSELNELISNAEHEIALAESEDAKVVLEEGLVDLQSQKADMNSRKLSLEKPYSYSLTFLFLGILILIAGIVKLTSKNTANTKTDLNRLAQAGLLAALCYIGFAFFKIDIPVGPEKTAFHLGNVFCVLAALLIGGFWGGLSGAIGMTIADLTTSYVTSAPKTFLLKLGIGLIVGFVAHKIFKLGKVKNKKQIAGITVFASFCGMAFNVVADPVVGYFYKTYLLGIPQDLAKALAKMSAITTFVNAIVAVICASIFYLALRPALKKAAFLKDQE